MLKGYEGFWISLRRNDLYYALNKILSFVISICFAVLTLYLKYKSINMFEKQNNDPEDKEKT